MSTPLARACSAIVGWAADRRLPRALRPFAHRTFARLTGADLSEVRPPLDAYPSVGAFFVRRLVDGARTFPENERSFGSPCDGHVQTIETACGDSILQAKGQPYSLRELLAGAEAPFGGLEGVDLEGARVWTLYLSPSDYHRLHCPIRSRLDRVVWAGGCRYSVAPSVLERKPRVFVRNERAVLRLESDRGPWFLVLVGALNVGRIRVVGVPQGAETPNRSDPRFELGEELGRFELGSTAIVVWPGPGPDPIAGLEIGDPVCMGQPIAEFPSNGAGR